MYKVLYGSDIIFDPDEDEHYVTDCTADLKLNEASSLSFTLPVGHELNGNIALFDVEREITLYRDDLELFRGRAVSETLDMDGNCTYECEGVRAYLNDVLLPPYTTAYSSDTASGTLEAPSAVDQLFEWYVAKYNERCTKQHQLSIGINEGAQLDANNYVLRSNSNRATVWSEIKEKLIDKLGGFIFMRYEGGQHFIDYRQSASERSAQEVEFGVNLLDFERERTGDNLGTVCIPTGKDDDNNEINIKSLADGEYNGYKKSGEAVYNDDAVQKYGWIEFSETTDANTAKGVLNAGIKALQDKGIADTITVSALDLTITSDYDDNNMPYAHMLKEGFQVYIDTGAHDLVGTSTCTSRHLDLLDPSQDTYDLQNDASFAKRVDTSLIIDERFANYLDRTATEAKVIAGNAETTAQNALSDVEAVKNSIQSIALVGRSAFKNNDDSETLKVNLWCGIDGESTKITDYVGLVKQCGDTACIRWFARNPNEKEETEITTTATDDGFSLVVNASDVDSWKYFRVGVYIDDVQVRTTTRTMTDANDGFTLLLTPDNIVVPASASGSATPTTYTAKWSCYWGADDYSDSATVSSFNYDTKKLKASYDNKTQTITIITLETMTEDASVSVEFLIDCIGPEVWLDRAITLTLAKEGRGVDSTTQLYGLSGDAQTQPENWLSEVPTMTTDEPCLWTYDKTTYTDKTTTETDPRMIGAYGETGEAGTGVSSIVRQYALSTSSTSAPATSSSLWSNTPADYKSGRYYWERDYITWTDGKTTYTSGVLSAGLNSANSTALDASTTATNANTTANNANATANTAKENASTALTNATKANNKMHYATCSNAGSDTVKTATLKSSGALTLTDGVCVSVKFTYANTYSGTATTPLKLNVGGTGAKPILTNGGSNSAYWRATQSVLFTYDTSYSGGAWRVASEPVYASTVTVGNSAANNVYIDSTGVAIRYGTGTKLAQFRSDKVIIGETGSSDINAQMDTNTFQICQGNTGYISMGYNADNGAIIKTQNSKPLFLETACNINGDGSWSGASRNGILSSWVDRDTRHGLWHILTYTKQPNSSYFYVDMIYSGSSSATSSAIQINYPGNLKLTKNYPYYANVATCETGTTSSYAGYVQPNSTALYFYPSNTVGTHQAVQFTVHVCGYFSS